jgi:hypothetical protein
VSYPGFPNQSALRVPLSSPFGSAKVDDTIFATASKGFILVSDLDANTVYAVHKRWFAPGAAYSAANVLGFVGRLE